MCCLECATVRVEAVAQGSGAFECELVQRAGMGVEICDAQPKTLQASTGRTHGDGTMAPAQVDSACATYPFCAFDRPVTLQLRSGRGFNRRLVETQRRPWSAFFFSSSRPLRLSSAAGQLSRSVGEVPTVGGIVRLSIRAPSATVAASRTHTLLRWRRLRLPLSASPVRTARSLRPRPSSRRAAALPCASMVLSYRHAFHAGNFADVVKVGTIFAHCCPRRHCLDAFGWMRA